MKKKTGPNMTKWSNFRFGINESIDGMEPQLDEAFSRVHYNKIAEVFRNFDNKDDIIVRLADMFEEDNPKFDRQMFLDAAGHSGKYTVY